MGIYKLILLFWFTEPDAELLFFCRKVNHNSEVIFVILLTVL